MLVKSSSTCGYGHNWRVIHYKVIKLFEVIVFVFTGEFPITTRFIEHCLDTGDIFINPVDAEIIGVHYEQVDLTIDRTM